MNNPQIRRYKELLRTILAGIELTDEENDELNDLAQEFESEEDHSLIDPGYLGDR
jgi:hypothetical protein